MSKLAVKALLTDTHNITGKELNCPIQSNISVLLPSDENLWFNGIQFWGYRTDPSELAKIYPMPMEEFYNGALTLYRIFTEHRHKIVLEVQDHKFSAESIYITGESSDLNYVDMRRTIQRIIVRLFEFLRIASDFKKVPVYKMVLIHYLLWAWASVEFRQNNLMPSHSRTLVPKMAFLEPPYFEPQDRSTELILELRSKGGTRSFRNDLRNTEKIYFRISSDFKMLLEYYSKLKTEIEQNPSFTALTMNIIHQS